MAGTPLQSELYLYYKAPLQQGKATNVDLAKSKKCAVAPTNQPTILNEDLQIQIPFFLPSEESMDGYHRAILYYLKNMAPIRIYS